ncbi:MAG: T9SS type A sorting domain-containing protein [Muribaculaceae bacterium]|nr:T9SS type A sorting domain-containing protein [Muribaculaceae bacterium]
MGEQESTDFSGSSSLDMMVTRPAISLEGDCLVAGAEAMGAQLEVYTTSGSLLKSMRLAKARTPLNLEAGIYLIRISGRAIAPVTLKVAK